MCPKNIEVELTDQAVNRMRECGCNPLEIVQYLYSGVLPVTKNIYGFEISVPFKGSLAGTFDQDVFVAKSFFQPFHYGKYYCYDKNSKNQFNVTVSTVRRSGLKRIVISRGRTIAVSLFDFGTTESERPHIIPMSAYAGE
jgi:hypothetical protein